MDQRMRDALDDHITGHYGEDQFGGLTDDANESPEMEPPATANVFLVGVRGNHVTVLMAHRLADGITPAEAINLAAWLVAIAGAYAAESPLPSFEDTLAAIKAI